MKRTVFAALLLTLSLAVGLAACGRKGPLEPPERPRAMTATSG